MPKFTKSISELETRFDKWMYLIRNLNRLDKIPEELRDKIFEEVFSVAEIAKLNPNEMLEYEESLNVYRDFKNSIDTAKDDRSIEIAKNSLKEGLSIEVIMKITGLSKEKIEKIKSEG